MKPYSLYLSLFGALAPSPNSFAQSPASIETQVDAIFAEAIKAQGPGCALGVYQNGETLYEKGYGLANLEHQVPINPSQTVFDLGSVSKQFTAASILLLVQDGKVKLDDDVRKYVPELPDYGAAITVAQLIHHTSGLRDYSSLLALSGWLAADHTNDADALNIIVSQKTLDFTPGTRFTYNNTGYFLMSLIVERVSGKTLSTFAAERIFKPLAMNNTFFFDDYQRVIPHRASAYGSNDKTGFSLVMSNWTQTGDGALQSTVSDLAKWQRNFDQPSIGGVKFIDLMEQTGVLANGESLNYGSGLFVEAYRGLRQVSHSGYWAGYRTELLRFSEAKLSIALLCNSADVNPQDLARRVAHVFLEKKLGKLEPAFSSSAKSITQAPTEWLGTYWSRASGLVRTIAYDESKLWYVRSAQSRTEIGRGKRGRLGFMDADAVIEWQRTGKQVTGFKLILANETFSFERVETVQPNARVLADYAGNFQSSELNNTRWTFSVKDQQLFIKMPREEAYAVLPAFKDAFMAGAVLLRFQRNSANEVAGLRIDADEVYDLPFERTLSQ
jgi:CubicO group peptidase (beta-lactamase class C family)